MQAEIVAVGDELLLGSRVNANAAWLGQRLAEAGIRMTRSVAVGDDLDAIVAALADASATTDAVILTGGLGPTSDDRTREALARAAGVALERDPDTERDLRERYARLDVPVRSSALVQADIPRGAALLPNAHGTAPGLRLEVAGAVVHALPGVPREMESMFTGSVLPDLLSRGGGRDAAAASRTLHTAAAWESSVAQRLAGLEDEFAAAGNPTLAYLASPGEVQVRLTGHAATRAEARALVERAEARARSLLGETVYGVDGETLEGVVHELLARHGATVAVAESLTGGLLGQRLTATPGASATFLGGVIAYATGAKASILGVPEGLLEARGAVDPEVAEAMAAGVRDRLGATYGLGLTGVAGPGPEEDNPPGTLHVGLAGPEGLRTRASPRLPGDRAHNRTQAAVHALDVLRRHLLGAQPFRGWED